MEEYLSTGEFAEKASVTIRTLRYYDKIGILKPSKHNEKGHRLYSMKDFIKLQKILTLKFIGLSLEDINKIMLFDNQNGDLKNSLNLQRKIIQDKISHFNTVIDAIDKVLGNMPTNGGSPPWEEIISIIGIVNTNDKWLQQYKDATNLRSRISIHEKYSKNKEGWMPWFFKKILDLNLKGEIKILELGCGDASLWIKNFNKIPKSFSITLSDFSKGMLEDAKRNLNVNSHKFNFKLINAEDIPYTEDEFDIVIANHMLYHLSDIHQGLKEIKRVLKPNGYCFASTVGVNHMKELRDIIENFNSKELTSESWNSTNNFNLENGKDILDKYFKNIILSKYEDALIIDEALPLIHYIFSMPGNVKDNFNEKLYKKLVNYIEDIIINKNIITITKDTGFFMCQK
ncbi:MerR family transcriptional regulator [Hathewaya histolytica]|uniref:MerR family transcriptional regulator n=1 Tax=Hathewaya histolytica TaxID=1498 RepID=UPI003B675851